MKLYTEEQVKKAIDEARFTVNGDERYSKDEILDSLTPIELPSDKEIETKAVIAYKGKDFAEQRTNAHLIIVFEEGAKWMKEQILNQNK